MEQYINRIVIVSKNNYDDINLTINGKSYILNKVDSQDDFNTYNISCCINFTNEYLRFSSTNILDGSIIDDDLNYNHCLELCENKYTESTKEEITYSVFLTFGNYYQSHAITVYVLLAGG